MPGRSFKAGSSYRYGFNGQEKSDDATAGNYTAMYWEYDSRTGRRWNVDPRQKVQESPYLGFGGNPIWYKDPLGDTTINGHKYEGANAKSSTTLEEVIVSASKPKNNIKEFALKWAADRYSPSAIISVSKLYHKEGEKYEGDNFDLRFNSKKAVAVMLYGFATGQGIRDYKFDLESPVSVDFFNGGASGGRNIASEIQTSLYTKINTLNIGLSELKKGWKTSLGITFSPDHTGSVYEAFKKHVNSNSIQFFTGGATAYVTILNNNIFISVYNESSRKSFFAHGKFGLSWAAQNTERASANSSGEPLSTITQTFETVLSLDESRIRKK